MICIRVVGGLARRSLAVALLSVTSALAGCNGSSEPLGPTATVPQATTTTNPYAVPAVIDIAYVNRVLAGLDQAVGEVTRLTVNSQSIPPEAIERLKAAYLDKDLLQLAVDVYQDRLISEFAGMIPNPGNRVTTVVELISASPDCIFAKVDVDVSAMFEQPNPRFRVQWVGLIPVDAGIDLTQYNPTT
jgi:hypothetical protein